MAARLLTFALIMPPSTVFRPSFTLASGCVLLLLAFTSGCQSPTAATSPAASTVTSEAQAENGEAWVQTELYFSIAVEGREGFDERLAQWREFLDEEITPRFPAGLTVLDGLGKWRNDETGQISPALTTRVVVLLHPDTADNESRIAAIRTAWLDLTGQISVMRVKTEGAVDF